MIKFTVTEYTHFYRIFRGEKDEKGAAIMFASAAYVWAKIINYLEERLSSLTISASFDDAEIIELNEEQIGRAHV